MMPLSRISKIDNWIYAAVAAALPNHVILNDTEDLEENFESQLNAGYGTTMGDGEPREREIQDGSYYQVREFTVIITRDYLAQQADGHSRRMKRQALMEDLHAVRLALIGNRVIKEEGTTRVLSFDLKFTGDSGPRDTVIGGKPFLFIEMKVSAEYREPKTGGA